MLDGAEVFALGQGDVLDRHIVLEVDPLPPFRAGLRPGRRNGIRMRLAFTAKDFGKRVLSRSGAHDLQAGKVFARHKGGNGLVIG